MYHNWLLNLDLGLGFIFQFLSTSNMKLFKPVYLSISLLFITGCIHHEKKYVKANELAYATEDFKNSQIKIESVVNADVSKQQIKASLKIDNNGAGILNISEVSIVSPDGVRSLPVKGFMPFILTKADTTLTLIFEPINDLKTFQVTGLKGYLKSSYSLSISFHPQDGTDTQQPAIIKVKADTSDYQRLLKNKIKPLIAYSFNTKTNFNQNQMNYLKTLKQVHQPPFVFLSAQEIAASGLNFRLKNHYIDDTLFVDLFLVNHSDFRLKIDTLSFDITPSPSLQQHQKTISIERISGAGANPGMVEKGDRVMIHFKKYLTLAKKNSEQLIIHLKNVFMITPKHSLFNEDADLTPLLFK